MSSSSSSTNGGGGGGGGSGSSGPVGNISRKHIVNQNYSDHQHPQQQQQQQYHHYHSTDEHIYKMAPEAVDPAILSRGSLSRRRYTRSALLLLRDEALSKYRPDCFNDPRLSSLGFWRQDLSSYPSNNNNYQNHGGGSGAGSGGGRMNSGGSVGGPGGLTGSSSNNPKNLMDHRSISSSHLMPAFIKRRTVGTGAGGGGSTQIGSTGLQPNDTIKELPLQQQQQQPHQQQQRYRKDQQDVVLSPQRKSINMGCQMPSSGHQLPDRDLPTTLRERRIGSGRLLPRDVNWDYRPDKESASSAGVTENDNNFNTYRSASSNNQQMPYRDHRNSQGTSGPGQDYREHRYERRSYGRNTVTTGADYDRDSRDGSNYVRRFISDLAGGSGGSSSHHSNNERRRQYGESRSDEPEWVSAGPISQHDTIELRGFDETEDTANYHRDRENAAAASKHSYKPYKGSGSGGNQQQQLYHNHREPPPNKVSNEKMMDVQEIEDGDPHIVANQPSPPPARSTPTKSICNDTNNNTNSGSEAKQQQQQQQAVNDNDEKKPNAEDRDSKHVDLNFEEFLKLDSLNDILVGDSNNREVGGSRFSQWFKRTSPPNHQSRRSSLHEELNNILNVDSNHGAMIKLAAQRHHQQLHHQQQQQHDNNGDKYFAPISPAANSQTNHALVEFFLKNNLIGQNVQNSNLNSAAMGSGNQCTAGSITSVEELEARMRKNESCSTTTASSHPNAGIQNPFGQLLAASNNMHHQSQSHHNHNSVTPTPPQQQDMEAFKKLLEQITPNLGKSVAVLSALQQQQQHQQMVLQQMLNRSKQDDLKKIIHQQQQRNQQQMQQHQVQQQQQQLLQKLSQVNGQLNQNDLLKGPEAQNIVQGLPQRILSPRELQFHTQTIMQSALIKKKLEEQQENYRRRQEIQKHHSHHQQQQIHQQQHQQHHIGVTNNNSQNMMPGGNNDSIDQLQFNHSPPPQQISQQQGSNKHQVNSPTPLAFTPTSVLRKMTAEKDSFGGSDAAKNMTAATNAMQSLLLTNAAVAAAHQQQQLQQQHQQQPQQQSQPRMILGSGSTVQQQQQHNAQSVAGGGGGGGGPPISPQTICLNQVLRNNAMKWNQMNMSQMAPLPKPMGRPILKGRPVSVVDPAATVATQSIIPPPQMYASKLEFHQQMQQQQQQQQAAQQQLQQQQQQQQQQHLQLLQRQRAIRAQYQMQYRQQVMQKPGGGGASPNSGAGIPGTNVNETSSSSTVSTSINGGNNSTTTASLSSTVANNNSNNPSIGINYQRDGGLSPTSNQLARWFSPELLAQASAGKLPSLNMGQALSLEEFERSIQHSSATVHN